MRTRLKCLRHAPHVILHLHFLCDMSQNKSSHQRSECQGSDCLLCCCSLEAFRARGRSCQAQLQSTKALRFTRVVANQRRMVNNWRFRQDCRQAPCCFDCKVGILKCSTKHLSHICFKHGSSGLVLRFSFFAVSIREIIFVC